MAMQPYSIVSFAPSGWWSKYNGSSLTNRQVSSRSLGNISSVAKGDYRSTYKHTYEKTVWRGWLGTVKTVGNGEIIEERWGVNPTPYVAVSYIPTGFNPDALSLAAIQAYDKLRGSVDLSVDLVQWRQTLRMISLYRRFVAGIAESAVKLLPITTKFNRTRVLLENSRRGSKRRRQLAREVNSLANQLARARLEYTYGWSPTMATIHDFAKLAVTPPPQQGLLQCEGKASIITHEKKLIGTSTVKEEHVIKVSDRAAIKMFYNPPVSVLNQLGQISSLNPVSILYEVIPFSFVLDWAIDIGSWIRTLETAFLHRNEFVIGWQVQLRRTTIASQKIGVERPLQNQTISWDLKGNLTSQRYFRTLLNTPVFPIRPVKQFTFGVGRQLNAIALAKATLLNADDAIAGRRYH